MLEKGPIFFKKGRLQVLWDEKNDKNEQNVVKIEEIDEKKKVVNHPIHILSLFNMFLIVET